MHFKKKLGIHLPESTVRGLRAKFQRRFNDEADVVDDVSELDHHRRGRPMRLGKYDSVVRECIEKLVSSSDEKVTSFMAIATARQVSEVFLYLQGSGFDAKWWLIRVVQSYNLN